MSQIITASPVSPIVRNGHFRYSLDNVNGRLYYDVLHTILNTNTYSIYPRQFAALRSGQ